ncbi:MAG: hypothetical protein WB973_16620 [Thermoanaerobaculia bacterium]
MQPDQPQVSLTDDEKLVFELVSKAQHPSTLRALSSLRDFEQRSIAEELKGYARSWSHPLELALK